MICGLLTKNCVFPRRWIFTCWYIKNMHNHKFEFISTVDTPGIFSKTQNQHLEYILIVALFIVGFVFL